MKNIKKISLLVAASASICSLAACGGKENDMTKLNVIVLKKGYGDEWIKDAVALWEKENPGYTVNLTADPNAAGKIKSNINSSSNVDDVYICTDGEWKTYANSGKFLELDSFIKEKVDGMTIEDKLTDEYKDSIKYVTSTGERHVYRLPWTAGVGGIYFNAKMFEDNNWEVPTTTDELIQLCANIVKANIPSGTDPFTPVKPFVYTSENTDYFDYAVLSWWSQLAGKNNIKDFFKYGDAGVYDIASTSHKAYKSLKDATQIWLDIFKNPANVLSKTNANYAQSAFLNGDAAMMVNCEWLYNELSNYLAQSGKSYADYPDFKLELMKTPVAKGAVEANNGYIVGEDQFIAIPKSSAKPELAKSFVKTLVSDKVLKIFNTKANGFMAYKLSNNQKYDRGLNDCMDSILDYRESLDFTFTNYSESRRYLNNSIDVWLTSAYRPFADLIDTKSPISIDKAFEDIKKAAAVGWDEWNY